MSICEMNIISISIYVYMYIYMYIYIHMYIYIKACQRGDRADHIGVDLHIKWQIILGLTYIWKWQAYHTGRPAILMHPWFYEKYLRSPVSVSHPRKSLIYLQSLWDDYHLASYDRSQEYRLMGNQAATSSSVWLTQFDRDRFYLRRLT